MEMIFFATQQGRSNNRIIVYVFAIGDWHMTNAKSQNMKHNSDKQAIKQIIIWFWLALAKREMT